jgi:hypothetical protein
MTRSFKKQPMHGCSCAASEKEDKARAHRRLRSHFRTTLNSARSLDTFEFVERNEAHSDVWDHAKDGKVRTNVRVRHIGRATQVLHAPTWLRGARELHKFLGK